MNLAVVTNILTPYRIPLFEALRRRVDDFTVLLMAEREENRQWQLEQSPFKTVVLHGVHYRPAGRQVSLHLNYGVISALRRLSPDVVLSGGFGPANVAAMVYCKVFGKRFVGWGELIHGEPSSLLRRVIRRWMTKWSDGSIASSSDARDVFLHYGANAERVLTSVMPIDVDLFYRETKTFRETPKCRNLQAVYSRPILLSVGRIVSQKGYPELFQMYRRLLEVWPQASMIIVGDGPDKARYESNAKACGWGNVHFVGFKQTLELIRFLGIADLFVFPTLGDPFGAVLSEAMAAGLPVVSSVYAAATRDLVEDGVSGFRIDPKDTEASAAAILKVLDMDPQHRAALGEAAYLRVKQFDIPASAESMVGFMESVRRGRRRGADHPVGCRE